MSINPHQHLISDKMKELIRDILREQGEVGPTDEMGRTQHGRDVLDTKISKFKEKLRLFFTYMKTIGGDGGCEELLEYYENNGAPTNYGEAGNEDNERNRSEMYQLQNKIDNGYKILGLYPTSRTNMTLYALLVNYVHNGGSDRIFSEGELELVKAKMYEIDINVSETLTEWSSMYCDIFTKDKNKAIELASERPFTFEVDRESHDHDYHGDMKVESVGNTDLREIELTPEMFGL